VAHHHTKRFGERGPQNAQLLPVKNREPVKQGFTMRSQLDQNLSLILMAVPATHRASFHEAVYQFDSAVVADTKVLRNRSDGGTSTPRQSLQCQQDLMLLRFDPLGSSSLFAEMQKLPDAVTKLRKSPKAKFRYISAK
jgi:hypothetical protein